MEVAAPRKRARVSTGPRKRSGCLACKTAHVKCNESKPACDRCLRAGSDCVYPDPSKPTQSRRRRDPSQILFREPLTPNPETSLTLTAPSARKLDDMGYHVLRYFHERTLPTISYFVPASFWTETLLQMSESIPAIKYCILALGSWHLTVDKQSATTSTITIPLNNDTQNFSEESHQTALSVLRKDITARNLASSPIDVAVTASVLLAIYASLRGDRTQLITHVRLGLNLARQSEASSSLASVVEFNRRQLALLRLEEEMRAPIFDSLKISDEDTLADVLTATTIVEEGPETLSVDALAAKVLNMGNGVYRFARNCNRGLFVGNEPALLLERERMEAQCSQLRTQMMNACLSGTDIPFGKILRARLELSWVMLQAGWTLHQTSFDEYENNFGLILHLAEEVLRPASSRQQRLPFSVNLGLTPLLFYVSRLCRQPQLRRKAADLLEDCPTIEGMWNAREAVAVARFVIALEEICGDQKYVCADDYMISEERRIHSLRFGGSALDRNVPPTNMLDVTVMMRPEATSFALQDTLYRISTEEWCSGLGDLSNTIRL